MNNLTKKRVYDVYMYEEFNTIQDNEISIKKSIYFFHEYILANNLKEAFDLYQKRYPGNVNYRNYDKEKIDYIQRLHKYVEENGVILDINNPDYRYGMIGIDVTNRTDFEEAKEKLNEKDFLEYCEQ